MSAVFTWKIDEMHRQSTDGLVTLVFWRADATENGLFATNFGAVNLVRGETFIPYDELTEEMVLVWVKEKIDVAAVEQNLIQTIESQKNPPVLTGKPWDKL